MEQDQYLTLFQQYAVRMKEIRLLSTPDLNDIKDPDEFGRILTENFAKIGKLAIENRKIINDVLKPIMSSDVELTVLWLAKRMMKMQKYKPWQRK